MSNKSKTPETDGHRKGLGYQMLVLMTVLIVSLAGVYGIYQWEMQKVRQKNADLDYLNELVSIQPKLSKDVSLIEYESISITDPMNRYYAASDSGARKAMKGAIRGYNAYRHDLQKQYKKGLRLKCPNKQFTRLHALWRVFLQSNQGYVARIDKYVKRKDAAALLRYSDDKGKATKALASAEAVLDKEWDRCAAPYLSKKK